MRRFDPEFAAAHQRILAGEIGQPMMIKSLTHGPGLPPPWARDLKTSNGMLAEVNSHDWDTVRWLMGAELRPGLRRGCNVKGPDLQSRHP
jgi:scyllo-inositol 2-dehydrogenase (NAD+)